MLDGITRSAAKRSASLRHPFALVLLAVGGIVGGALFGMGWPLAVPGQGQAQAQEPEEPPPATVTVESKEIREGEEAILAVTLSGAPPGGLVSYQGTLAYDPTVLEILEVLFPEDCPVWAFNVEEGLLRFAATRCLQAGEEGLREGEVFRLRVRAVGAPDSVAVLLPVFEIFHDPEFQLIPHVVVEGTITILPAVNELPQASFEFSPQSPSTRDTIQFTDTSVDPDGEIVSWQWDFGDGTTSTEQNPTHRYEKGGLYTVTLTVTDDRDGQGTATVRLYVFPAPPEDAAGVIAFPNPASTQAKFRYFLPEGTTEAELRAFDLRGRPVLQASLDPTGRIYSWDLRDLRGNPVPNGPYFYLVRATAPQGVVRSRVEVLIVQR